MERKTKVHAEEGRQDLIITREFELPVDLLFKAHADPGLYEQWMGSHVVKLEPWKYGGWQLEKKDDRGQVVFGAHGVFHAFIPDHLIIRTFEMENAPFDAQLEFLEFEKQSEATSKLTMQIVYRSVVIRDQMLALPFAHGLNMAHDRLQEIITTYL